MWWNIDKFVKPNRAKSQARSGKYLSSKLETRNKPEIRNPNQVSDFGPESVESAKSVDEIPVCVIRVHLRFHLIPSLRNLWLGPNPELAQSVDLSQAASALISSTLPSVAQGAARSMRLTSPDRTLPVPTS